MKKVLAALAVVLCFAVPAHAQKTKAALTTEINTNWPDNTTGAITPALLRSTVLDVVASYVDWLTCSTAGAVAYWNGAGTPTCLLAGTTGQVLTAGTTPVYRDLASMMVAGAGISITGTTTPTVTAPIFTGASQGTVPLSPGTATTVIHGDGTWAGIDLSNTVSNKLPTANGGTNLVSTNDASATFITRVVSPVAFGGSTNDSSSGSGAFVDFTPTVAIPANFITANRAIRVRALYRFTTGGTAPPVNFRMKMGATTVLQFGPFTPITSMTSRTVAYDFMLVGLATPSASANTETALIGSSNQLANTTFFNSVSQPVALATNAGLTLTLGTQWDAAGVGVNTVTLSAIAVEALN